MMQGDLSKLAFMGACLLALALVPLLAGSFAVDLVLSLIHI